MCRVFKNIAFWLVIIGALNWGLIGLFNFDLVAFLLGEMTIWSRIVYILVGISAIVFGTLVYVCKDEDAAY